MCKITHPKRLSKTLVDDLTLIDKTFKTCIKNYKLTATENRTS